MRIISVTAYLDGGTIVYSCDNGRRYHIDNRLGSSAAGTVFSEYPPDGNIIVGDELADLIDAIQNCSDKTCKDSALKLLGVV